MLDWEYDDELAKKALRADIRDEVREEVREEVRDEVQRETTEKNTLETIKNLLKEKFPIAGIARVTGWSEEKILQIAKEI